MGVDAWTYCSFSELKLPAPSSPGIFEGENKCFDQGTVLLQGGEGGAREIIAFYAPAGSPGDRTYSMVTRRHPLSTRFPYFPSSLVSPVVARTFPFARKIARTSSLEIKRIFS